MFLVGVALLSEAHQTITVFLNQLQYEHCGISDSVIGLVYIVATLLGLRIVENQSLIAEERSMDSFFCGFKLAWELAYELNHLEIDRHLFPGEEAERDA